MLNNEVLLQKLEGILKINNNIGMTRLAKEVNYHYREFRNIISDFESKNIITINKIGSRKQIIINNVKSNILQVGDFNFSIHKSIIGDVILVSDAAKYLGIKSSIINSLIKRNEDSFVEKVGKIQIGKAKRISINKNGIQTLYRLMLDGINANINDKFIKLINAIEIRLSDKSQKEDKLIHNKELDDKIYNLKKEFNEIIDSLVNDVREVCTENQYLKQYNDKLALDKLNQKLIAKSKIEILEQGLNRLRNAKIQMVNNKYNN